MYIKLPAFSVRVQNSLSNIISYTLIFLFVYTAASKIAGHNQFEYTLGDIPLIGKFKGLLAWFIPAIELAISILLVIPGTKRIGLLLSGILLVVFTVFIGAMLLSKEKLPCSCGGVVQQLSWQQHLVFNIFFILLAFTAFQFSKRSKFLLQ